MDGRRLLTTIGLIRQARPNGFCPACRVLMKARDAGQELARPLLAALVVLAVAGVAWVAVVQHSRATAEMDGMDMGLGPIESFALMWVVMMAAMMLPSAMPVVLEFARAAERRRRWPVATGVLAAAYLGVWLLFGVVCYAIYTALGMPWPNQPVVTGLALALAGVYSLSPIKRASQARLFTALLGDGLDIGRPDVLRDLARQSGLDLARFEADYAGEAYEAVLRDCAEGAGGFGVSALPIPLAAEAGAAAGRSPVA